MPTIYCRHIRPSGRRCQTPALYGRPLCFHHATAKAHLRALQPPEDGTGNIIHEIATGELDAIRHQPLLAEYYSTSRGPVILDFPALEDVNSVQLALSMVLKVLGQNRLEPRRAASMLYNLQIAAGNARSLTSNETHSVVDILQDESGDVISPDEDPQEIVDARQFQKDIEQHDKDLKDGKFDDDDEEDDDF
jgi:hypothetical protein